MEVEAANVMNGSELLAAIVASEGIEVDLVLKHLSHADLLEAIGESEALGYFGIKEVSEE